MQTVMDVLGYVVYAIKLISVLVLIIGLVRCIASLLKGHFSKSVTTQSPVLIQRAKNQLGWYVLLGLEILIIGDIIETIINPSFADIGRLAAIVAIRTIISFFLNKEIKETDDIIEKVQTADEKTKPPPTAEG